MIKNILGGFFLFGLIVTFIGCASSDVKVRRYIVEKERLDQDVSGNAGYIMGSGEGRGDYKKTRQVYVVEFTKEVEAIDLDDIVIEDSDDVQRQPNVQRVERIAPVTVPDIQIPSFDDTESIPSSKPDGSFVEYIVQKDDTLQKISKKFYDSYSQWPKIYEHNKSVIPNPDQIQPGITINVPVE